MNVFSTPEYLELAGALFFPRARRQVELFRVEGRVLRLLVVDGKPVRTMPFYDFPQPLDAVPPGQAVQRLDYFPRTVVHTEPIEARQGPEPEGQQPSPYVEWARFESFAAWEAMVRSRHAVKSGDNARQVRRLERDLGPVRFVFDDGRPETFEAIVRWKSSQYRATGVGDMFARPENVELFRQLHRAGLVVISSYWAGETLLAGHFGSSHARRLTWWIPAYDPQFGKYSPGRLMLTELMRESQRRGDLEFDFLIGAEDYKFQFATHNRVIGPVGVPSLREQLLLTARKEARAALAKAPQLEALARNVKRTLQSLRGER